MYSLAQVQRDIQTVCSETNVSSAFAFRGLDLKSLGSHTAPAQTTKHHVIPARGGLSVTFRMG